MFLQISKEFRINLNCIESVTTGKTSSGFKKYRLYIPNAPEGLEFVEEPLEGLRIKFSVGTSMDVAITISEETPKYDAIGKWLKANTL